MISGIENLTRKYYFNSTSSGFSSLSPGFRALLADSEGKDSSSIDSVILGVGFLNCTNIIVILSHPSPLAVDGAKQRSRTLPHTVESFVSCTVHNVNHQFLFKCFRLYKS